MNCILCKKRPKANRQSKCSPCLAELKRNRVAMTQKGTVAKRDTRKAADLLPKEKTIVDATDSITGARILSVEGKTALVRFTHKKIPITDESLSVDNVFRRLQDKHQAHFNFGMSKTGEYSLQIHSETNKHFYGRDLMELLDAALA